MTSRQEYDRLVKHVKMINYKCDKCDYVKPCLKYYPQDMGAPVFCRTNPKPWGKLSEGDKIEFKRNILRFLVEQKIIY